MSELHDTTGQPGFPADDLPTLAEATGTPLPPDEPSQTPAQSAPLQPKPVKPRRRRRLYITLISVLLVVAILAAAGISGYRYVTQQYNQLTELGAQMCNDLEAHKYDALYQRFSSGLKSKYTAEEFSHYGAEIDQFEGNALSCGQADGNHYNLDIGKRTITVASVVNRDGTGAHSGNVRFLFKDGSWQVDDFDVGFLGMSLDALKLFDSYCAALQQRQFQDIYAMLGPGLRGQSEQDYLQTENLHLQVDGPVIECVLDGISADNAATSATFSLHIQRGSQIQQHYSAGSMTVGSTPSGWVITALDPTLDGRNLEPVYVANRWCSDIQSQNYKDSFGLLTTKLQQSTSLAVFSALYSGKQGDKWLNCAVNPSSYQGNERLDDKNVVLTAHVHLKNLRTGAETQDNGKIGFELENTHWKIDIVFLCGGSC